MNFRFLLTTAAACTFSINMASAEPKAYDVVHYKGQASGLALAFDFANGYPEASQLKVTTSAKKAIKFKLEDSEKFRFVSENSRDGAKEVSLQMGGYDDPPAKVEGTYKAGDKTVPFTLSKGK